MTTQIVDSVTWAHSPRELYAPIITYGFAWLICLDGSVAAACLHCLSDKFLCLFRTMSEIDRFLSEIFTHPEVEVC